MFVKIRHFETLRRGPSDPFPIVKGQQACARLYVSHLPALSPQVSIPRLRISFVED